MYFKIILETGSYKSPLKDYNLAIRYNVSVTSFLNVYEDMITRVSYTTFSFYVYYATITLSFL